MSRKISHQARPLNNRTSFASPNLTKLGWSLVLVAVIEVVGVLQATGEREVILVVAVIPVMSHFLLAVWQHLRHAESTKPGARTAAAVPFNPPSVLFLRERGQKKIKNPHAHHLRTHAHRHARAASSLFRDR